jgi:hypothetical protein
MKHRTIIVAALAAITSLNLGVALGGHTAGADDPAPATLVNVDPVRVLDTRLTGGPLEPGETVSVHSGYAGATAVGVNLTMTNVRTAGFVTAWDDGARPDTSIVNSNGADVANFVILPITSAGTFQLYTSARADVLVDVMGYFAPGIVAFDPGPPPTTEPTSTVPPTVAAGDRGPVERQMTATTSCPSAVTITNNDLGPHAIVAWYGLQLPITTVDGELLPMIEPGDSVTLDLTPARGYTADVFVDGGSYWRISDVAC